MPRDDWKGRHVELQHRQTGKRIMATIIADPPNGEGPVRFLTVEGEEVTTRDYLYRTV